jgi:hypothetical protein
LNEELTAKVKALMDERQSSAEIEADLQSKLKQVRPNLLGNRSGMKLMQDGRLH